MRVHRRSLLPARCAAGQARCRPGAKCCTYTTSSVRNASSAHHAHRCAPRLGRDGASTSMLLMCMHGCSLGSLERGGFRPRKKGCHVVTAHAMPCHARASMMGVGGAQSRNHHKKSMVHGIPPMLTAGSSGRPACFSCRPGARAGGGAHSAIAARSAAPCRACRLCCCLPSRVQPG